jgi:hypothetical protein
MCAAGGRGDPTRVRLRRVVAAGGQEVSDSGARCELEALTLADSFVPMPTVILTGATRGIGHAAVALPRPRTPPARRETFGQRLLSERLRTAVPPGAQERSACRTRFRSARRTWTRIDWAAPAPYCVDHPHHSHAGSCSRPWLSATKPLECRTYVASNALCSTTGRTPSSM